MKICKYILILLWPVLLQSQGVFNIGFDESLPLSEGELNYKFKFIENGKTIHLYKDEIRQYKFRYPGIYEIHIDKLSHKQNSTHEECGELELANQIQVRVDSVKIIFNPASLKLTKAIQKNKVANDITASIDAEIINYYKHTIRMNDDSIHAAGIGSSIHGKLDHTQKILNSGRHTLKYNLTGICSESSYIQFDFKTHNGNIVPIGLATPVIE